MVNRFSIALSLCLIGTNAWSVDLNPISKDYVDTVMVILDNQASQTSILEAIPELEKAQKAKAKTLSALEKKLTDSETRLQQLPSLIASEQASQKAKEDSVAVQMKSLFPEYANTSQLKVGVIQKQESLELELEQLERLMAQSDAAYDNQIQPLVDENSLLETNNDSMTTQNEELRSQNNDIQDNQIPTLRREIQRIQQKVDSGAAQSDLTAKQTEYNEKYKDVKCNFVKELFDKKCIKRNQLRAEIQELKQMLDGSLVQAKRRNIRDLDDQTETNRRQIKANRDTIADNESRILSNQNRIDRLIEDKRIANAPYKTRIADKKVEIALNESKVSQAQAIIALSEQAQKQTKKILDMQKEQAETLPALIAALPAQIQDAKTDLETTEASLSDKKVKLTETENVIVQGKLDLQQSQTLLQNAVEKNSGQIDLAAAFDLTETGKEEALYVDWKVLTASSDVAINRSLCKAQTEVASKTDSLVLKLQVVKYATPNGFTQPVVVVSVEGEGENMTVFENLQLQTKGTKNIYNFNFVPSSSAVNKRVFIGDLAERQALITDIIKKSDILASFASASSEEGGTFSLRGSNNALQAGSKGNLKKLCGSLSTSL